MLNIKYVKLTCPKNTYCKIFNFSQLFYRLSSTLLWTLTQLENPWFMQVILGGGKPPSFSKNTIFIGQKLLKAKINGQKSLLASTN